MRRFLVLWLAISLGSNTAQSSQTFGESSAAPPSIRVANDSDVLRAAIEEQQSSLGELAALGHLLDKARNPKTYLTLDERDQLLRPWSRFVSSSSHLDELARRYLGAFPDVERCTGSGCFDAFLLGRVAELTRLFHGALLVGLVGNARSLTWLLDEPRAGLALSAGRYRALRHSVDTGFHVNKVLQLTREALSAAEQGRLLQDGRADSERWVLSYWRAHQDDYIDAAPSPDPFRSWVHKSVQDPATGVLYGVQRDVIKEVAIFLGRTRVRHQGQHAISLPQIADMLPQLQPGDIVLEKTSWYLCNLFIDGFWGHSVLYLGSFEEAVAYFDTPEIASHYQALGYSGFADYVSARHPAAVRAWRRPNIRDDAPVRVIEGDGVAKQIVLNSAQDAFAGDYLAVLRARQLSRLDKAQAIVDALSYWRVSYDFDFDLRTESSLVCTELIARAYAAGAGKRGLHLNVDQISRGHYMIYPNGIARQYGAERGAPSQQLDFVYLLRANHDESRAYVGAEHEFLDSPGWRAGLKPF